MPHHLRTVKLSRDPQFVEKLRDVVGLYGNPLSGRWCFHLTKRVRSRRSTAPAHLVERFFGELTERQLHRLAVTSVGELIEHITRYIDRRNINPKPFVWTASVRQILKKVSKANKILATLH